MKKEEKEKQELGGRGGFIYPGLERAWKVPLPVWEGTMGDNGTLPILLFIVTSGNTPLSGCLCMLFKAHGIYADLDRYMRRRHLVGILVEGIKNCSL